jgi:AcrR family transcriptional regulator
MASSCLWAAREAANGDGRLRRLYIVAEAFLESRLTWMDCHNIRWVVMKINAHSLRTARSFKQARREAVAEAFAAAAEAVFARRGFEHATMQEIAREAGCATGTLYLYFKNKEELFQAIMDRQSAALYPLLRQAMDATRDPIEKIRLNTATFLNFYNAKWSVFQLFYSAPPGGRAHLSSSLQGDALREYLVFRDLEVGLLKQAQAAHKIRTDMPAEELVEFMHGVSLSTLARWSLQEHRPTQDEQLRLLWGFISAGLGVKGRRA